MRPRRAMRTRSCAPAPPAPTSTRMANENGVRSPLDISSDPEVETLQRSLLRGGAMLWFLNTLITIPVAHADGEDGVSVIESLAPRGDSPPLHVHRSED